MLRDHQVCYLFEVSKLAPVSQGVSGSMPTIEVSLLDISEHSNNCLYLFLNCWSTCISSKESYLIYIINWCYINLHYIQWRRRTTTTKLTCQVISVTMLLIKRLISTRLKNWPVRDKKRLRIRIILKAEMANLINSGFKWKVNLVTKHSNGN